MKVDLRCSCGGSTSVNVESGQKTATEECACGKVLFWSAESGQENATIVENPPTLGLSVGDDSKTHDKFGG